MLVSQPWCLRTMRNEFPHSVKKSVNMWKDKKKKRKGKYQGPEGVLLRAGNHSRLMQRVILWVLDQEKDCQKEQHWDTCWNLAWTVLSILCIHSKFPNFVAILWLYMRVFVLRKYGHSKYLGYDIHNLLSVVSKNYICIKMYVYKKKHKWMTKQMERKC